MIRLGAARSARVDRSTPAFYPYQRFVFAKDATVRRLASQTRITEAEYPALLAAAPPGTWAVDETGRLLLLPAGRAELDRSACLVLLREVVDPKNGLRSLPGDLLLTDVDRAGAPLLRRQLRKLEPTPR